MKRRAPIRLNALTAALMMKAMLEGPCTAQDLVGVCGLGLQSVARYIRAMRNVKAAHVAQWEQDSIGRFTVPAFAIGDRRDAARPKTDRIRKGRIERAARKRLMRLNSAMAGAIHQRREEPAPLTECV